MRISAVTNGGVRHTNDVVSEQTTTPVPQLGTQDVDKVSGKPPNNVKVTFVQLAPFTTMVLIPSE